MSEELAVVKYDVTDAALSELKAKYTGLKIVDTASYENVRVAIGEVREKRVGIEERRKELKASALEYGRKVDSEAKRITTLLLQIEEPLKTEKQKVDDEKARIKAEKEQVERDRVAAIRARIFDMVMLTSNLLGKNSVELQQISERLFDMNITKEVYQEFTDEAERVKMECLEASLKAREMRITWEQEEAARRADAERLEKQRQEQEAEANRLADEKARLEADKKAEQDRKDRERITEEARVKAEQEAQEKFARVEREKREREEAEAKEKERKAAAAPDKEKLLIYAHLLEVSIQAPPLESEKAMIILSDALKAIKGVVAMIRKEAGKL